MDTQKEHLKVFACKIEDVFSGDDLVVMVDLGVESLWKRVRVRLHGVDTPNAIREKSESGEGARVRDLVRERVRNRRGILTVVSTANKNWICRLEVESRQGKFNLNDFLIEQGYVMVRKEATQ